MAPTLAASGTARQRFIREARAAAAVTPRPRRRPSTPSRRPAPPPYLVMQFIAGLSLQEKLDRTGRWPLKEILRIGMQTAAGLAAAHKQGLVHRDIKPANILLENGVERVKITDFGLARAADDASLTQSGVVAGTPQYMSPEQADGEPVDHRTDLFSLGSVLYAMCTGRPPFRADTAMAVLKRSARTRPAPSAKSTPTCPTGSRTWSRSSTPSTLPIDMHRPRRCRSRPEPDVLELQSGAKVQRCRCGPQPR